MVAVNFLMIASIRRRRLCSVRTPQFTRVLTANHRAIRECHDPHVSVEVTVDDEAWHQML